MKILRYLLAVALMPVLVVALNHHSTAQSVNQIQNQKPINKLEQLVIPLLKRGDSNTVAQISDFVSSIDKERSATDASFYVRILTSLRSGKTNDALELLETRLDGAVISFDYDRDSQYDKLLVRAKEYRGKYPHKSGMPEIDTAVARVFDSLPKE